MKKYLALVLCIIFIGLVSGCGKNYARNYKVAMITDFGEITDQSFNQTVYTACKDYCDSENIVFEYFKPDADDDMYRIESIHTAAEKGYNLIVLPGFNFINPIIETAYLYPEIKFVAIDISKEDLLSGLLKEKYNGKPSDYELSDYDEFKNVYCESFQEEISGFMAGYAAVSMGYKDLGFIGGMDVPAVKRYGYGFIQGCEIACAEKDTTANVNYIYSGGFYPNSDIVSLAKEWYQDGTEVIFVAGGSIYSSVAEAAKMNDGKIIGVDVNQAGVINKLSKEGTTVTSAMKGLHACTYDTLENIIKNNKWNEYAGKSENLGIVSGTDPKSNYCQLPLKDTKFNEGFTENDYIKMVGMLHSKEIKVSSDIENMPSTKLTSINYQGFIN